VCIAVAALAAAAAAGWWSIREARTGSRRPEPGDPPGAMERSDDAPRARRPLFEPWMVATAALLIAGLVVAPRLFGITFLLLPFLLGGRRRPPRRPEGAGDDPRWSSPE
jgi:hypothetical protein